MRIAFAMIAAGLLLAGCRPTFQPQPGADPPDDDPGATALTTELVVSGLSRPVFVTAPPGDPERLFILEQHTGRVRVYDVPARTLRETAFLTIDGLATGNEQGLLGFAFAADYADTGRFYINYTRSTPGGSETHVARGTVSDDPNIADDALEVLLTIEQPFSNHNGGWIGFGQDGYLYIASGDGGSANDPGDRAQDMDSLLGKLLRIDVRDETGFSIPPDNPFVGGDGDDRIWAYGLRNPWRCSFDRATGDLYIADVGQNMVEEIDVQPASVATAVNYGWPCLEGSTCLGARTNCACDDDVLVGPVYEYGHASGCSVTGGYVYRGTVIPDLQGTYFFADFCSNDILSLRYDGASATGVIDRTEELAPGGDLSIIGISSFGEDACGELYICELAGGAVYKIVPASGSMTDCNDNHVADECDIRTGHSADTNGDGVPDECAP